MSIVLCLFYAIVLMIFRTLCGFVQFTVNGTFCISNYEHLKSLVVISPLQTLLQFIERFSNYFSNSLIDQKVKNKLKVRLRENGLNFNLYILLNFNEKRLRYITCFLSGWGRRRLGRCGERAREKVQSAGNNAVTLNAYIAAEVFRSITFSKRLWIFLEPGKVYSLFLFTEVNSGEELV